MDREPGSGAQRKLRERRRDADLADTLAAIAGPIAESMHGIPDALVETAKEVYLARAPDMVEVLQRMYADVE